MRLAPHWNTLQRLLRRTKDSVTERWVSRKPGDSLLFILLVSRFLTSVVTVVLVFTLMVPQLYKNSKSMNLIRLDTSTLDIFSGLYASLGAVLSSSPNEDNFGEELTTSQVIAATNLTKSALQNTPDYISSSLYNYCAHYTHHWAYYDPNERNPHDAYEVPAVDTDQIDFTNTTLQCFPMDLYDYRSLLVLYFGALVEVIYAQDSNLEETIGDTNLVSPATQPSYLRYINHQRRFALEKIPVYIVFIGVSQVFIVASSVIYYRLIADPRKAAVFGHFNSALSLVVFVVGTVWNISTSVSLRSYKQRIHSELSAFKIALHFGEAWFSVSWTIFALTFVNMVTWMGPMWCSTPEDDPDEEEGHALYGTRAYDSTEVFEIDNRSIQIPAIILSKQDEPFSPNFADPVSSKPQFYTQEENYSGSLLDSVEIDLLNAPGTSFEAKF